MVDGETIEEAVAREVMEETGQEVLKSRYVSSYYFEPKQLIMIGFIAHVKNKEFGNSEEVDDVIARENNCSGMHFDACRKYLE